MTLNDEMQRLSQDFLGAYDDRMAAVAGIRPATAHQLAEFHAAHQEMTEELRARLDDQESARRAEAAEDARGRDEYVDELRGDTAAFIKELDAAQQEMAAELRARLDDQESGRRAEAAEAARGRMEYVDGLHHDTAAMLSGFQVEQSEARQVWSSFTTLMQQRRAGKPAERPRRPPPRGKKVVAAPPPVVGEEAALDSYRLP